MKEQCQETMVLALQNQDIILETLKDVGMNATPKEKLLTFLLSEFEPKFGFHLIYNVLRQLKAIEKTDFTHLLKVHQHLQKK